MTQAGTRQRRTGETLAKSGLIQGQPIFPGHVQQPVIRTEGGIAMGYCLPVPGANVLTNIAAEKITRHEGLQAKRHGILPLNRVVRNATIRIHNAGG